MWDEGAAEWMVLQTTDQNHTSAMIDLGVCDNGGCHSRRVVVR